jgi:hypothetical protein
MEEKKLNLGKVLLGILIKEHLQQSFRDMGIEKTEETIKKVYKGKTQTRLLYYYSELLRRR